MSPASNSPHATIAAQYKTSLSLGHLLKQRREELNLSLEQAEKDTKIRREYLEYIEAGNYERLRDDIYSRGYVKNYADYLGLETAPILLLYKKERQQRAQTLKLRDSKNRTKIGLTPIDSPRWIITPRTFVVICIVGLLGLVLGYLVYQFTGLAAAPQLSLDGGTGAVTLTSNVAFVAGHVTQGADVFINDSPILTDGHGAFREKITLVAGANQIRISARNRLGKTASVTKTYVAQLPAESNQTPTTGSAASANAASAAAQPAPAEGVQLKLTITHGTSWVIATADGVEIYRGTMVAGSSQQLAAANDLKLSVGNAGTVDAVLTNSKVRSRDLGVLGRDGQTINDLDFTTTTAP